MKHVDDVGRRSMSSPGTTIKVESRRTQTDSQSVKEIYKTEQWTERRERGETVGIYIYIYT